MFDPVGRDDLTMLLLDSTARPVCSGSRMYRSLLACLALLSLTSCHTGARSAGDAAAQTAYPEVARGNQVDIYHGVRVADPYRWMEALDSAQTRAFIEAENALSKPYLEAIPARARIKERLTQLWNYERYDVPVKRGGRYFYRRNDGLQNQSVLYVAESLKAAPRVLLDPNALSADATIALGEFVPSDDGQLLAYSLSDGGTDWRTWRIRDVARGTDLPDTLQFIKFRDVAWTPDRKAMYYSRYPQLPDGRGDDTKQMEIYLHVLGTQQAQDTLVFRITDHPRRNPYPTVSANGRFLVINVFDGYRSTGVYLQRLNEQGLPEGQVMRLFDRFDGEYQFIEAAENTVYVRTTAEAPNGRIVAVDIDASNRATVRLVVPEQSQALIDASLVGGRLVAHYLKDAYSQVRLFDLDGRALTDVKLPGFGQVEGLFGVPDDPETFFSYTDFLTPAAITRLDVRTGELSVFKAPKLPIETSAYVVEQVFFHSKDNTRVPMFVARKRDIHLTGDNPTLLYGYGGFGIPQQPAFNVPVLVWLEMGGVFALPNLRGGAEYGDAWHAAGTKLQKQTVFDDFIAAAQWLTEQRYTSRARLAIRGRSNGGLLVGAVMLQRPDLFAAALPNVGVLDMLRYHTASANAYQWSSDYGTVEDRAEFDALRAYSPLHNLRAGVCYPSTLITTADHDDRVVPWHSFKFAAALQHQQSCGNPVLLRVETRAGHGSGKPVWMQIEDFADQWAFLVRSLHME
ncbi:MAG: prolyl oligopeptidase family serine peptidase [Steroidobacteraceae bacterium]